MDTIFVKNVREKGPAHQAGLCTGKGEKKTVCVQLKLYVHRNDMTSDEWLVHSNVHTNVWDDNSVQ